MANTYSQLYVHVVFAVKHRQNLILKGWKNELYQYISGIISNKDLKLMIVNGVADHIHLLIGIKPNCNLSDLIRDIKANSSKWINGQNYVVGKFEWQTGFGTFSVSQSQLSKVINYIKRQEEHLKVKTFKEEYIEFLKAYHIDYNESYIFEDV
jgi:REP element-mobilizing transposase RayT